jgi:hypothetical protein
MEIQKVKVKHEDEGLICFCKKQHFLSDFSRQMIWVDYPDTWDVVRKGYSNYRPHLTCVCGRFYELIEDEESGAKTVEYIGILCRNCSIKNEKGKRVHHKTVYKITDGKTSTDGFHFSCKTHYDNTLKHWKEQFDLAQERFNTFNTAQLIEDVEEDEREIEFNQSKTRMQDWNEKHPWDEEDQSKGAPDAGS